MPPVLAHTENAEELRIASLEARETYLDERLKELLKDRYS